MIVSIIGQGRCAPWKLAVSEVVQDTLFGAIEGGVEGGISGHRATGTLEGALRGAATGAAFGALMGGGMSSLGNIAGLMKSCFSAGTPLLTPDGSKPIEAFRPGDLVLSRDENLLGGPIEPKVAEAISNHW